MPSAQQHRVLGREYGKGWERRFAEFNEEPIAAASIGQVHRARARDGRELALKIREIAKEHGVLSGIAYQKALEVAARGLTCTTAVHICYGYGIKANNDWIETLGQEWRQYAQVFPALAASSIQQVSLECYQSHVPPDLMALLKDKDVMVGVIDVASDVIETPEQVADTIGIALQHVPRHRIFPCTNCGLAPMSREVATKKLEALAQGAALARQRYGA